MAMRGACFDLARRVLLAAGMNSEQIVLHSEGVLMAISLHREQT